MSRILSCLLLFALSVSIVSCSADGVFDADLAKDIASTIQEKLPSKEEFRRMAEAHIATLPADEQAKARRDLEEALNEWPTDAELDRKIEEAIDEFAAEAPTRSEIESALNEAAEELPSKAELHDLVDQLPEEAELKTAIDKGIAGFLEAMDSVSRELKKQDN